MTADYLTADEVAERYRTSANTVRFWRTKGYGPRHVRVGRRVLYSHDEVARFDRELAATHEPEGHPTPGQQEASAALERPEAVTSAP